jgi:hypothetical protein
MSRILLYGFQQVIFMDELLGESFEAHGESGRIDFGFEQVMMTQVLFGTIIVLLLLLLLL